MMRVRRFLLVLSVCLLAVGLCSMAADIHTAVASGTADAVSAELAKNASSVNLPDDNGSTPLHIAAEKRNAGIIRLLLAGGANPAAGDRSGRTPLYVAVNADALDCVQAIVTQTTAGYIDPLLDIRQTAGADALRDGTLARANKLLGQLVRQDPGNASLNFAYGMSWLSLGDPAPAGAALERVLQLDPKNARARAELARTRIAARRYPEARRELEHVLASDLPPDVRQTVEDCLRDVKRHLTRWQFSGGLELGWLHDNNANVGPHSELIPISPVTIFGHEVTVFRVSPASRPLDTTGFSATAGTSALYDGGAPGYWLLALDASGYRNWLNDGDCDIASVQAGIGTRYMSGRNLLQVPFRARYMEYGNEPLTWVYGLYPAWVFTPASLDGVSFTTLPSIELRDFDTLTDRNGYYVSLGETVQKRFAQGACSLYGGVELQHDQADSAEYEYTGAGISVGGQARLPWRTTLFGEARGLTRNYVGRNALAPEDRRDAQYQFSAGVSRAVATRFAVTLTHSIINNDSSFDLYEYRRQITTISTRVRF